MRVVGNQSVEKISEDFDDDIRFINSVVEFLNDIRWIKQDRTSGLYKITEIGKKKSHTSKLIILDMI